MSLYLPPNFASDIQVRDTSLVPVVTIGTDIIISTNEYTNYLSGAFEYRTKPLLLNIPSLKESIDIEKRNYKISNITLSISNLPYEGIRFSDIVATRSFINEECYIYWRSPSCADITGTTNSPTRMPIIYYGVIRRYDHDDEKVKLIVEDRSQSKLHIDLPTANLGTGTEVPNAYKNAPIPMVFGHVNRSPCVYEVSGDDPDQGFSSLKLKIIADSQPLTFPTITKDWYGEDLYTIPTDPLWIYYDNHYFNVINKPQINNASTYYTMPNYTIPTSGSSILLEPHSGGATDSALNSIADNMLQVGILKIPRAIAPFSTSYNDETHSHDHILLSNSINAIAHSSEAVRVESTLDINEWSRVKFEFDGLDESKLFVVNHYFLIDFLYEVELAAAYFSYVAFTFSRYGSGGDGLLMPGGIFNDWFDAQTPSNMSIGKTYKINNLFQSTLNTAETDYEASATENDPMGMQMATIESTTWQRVVFSKHSFSIPLHFGFDFSLSGGNAGGEGGIGGNLGGIAIYNIALLKEIDTYDYFANVIGRTGASPTAPQIINNIMVNELGQSAIDSPTGYSTWKYAFTVNKKINSKKLIQGIASASPFIPRFNNLGTFKFDTIPDDGGIAIHTIYEEDVIDFSFTRSKIEDVKTRIEFKYNYDYGFEEFQSSIVPMGIHDFLSADDQQTIYYNPEYYGFKWDSSGADIDHVDTTLIVDDERGEYIRDDNTAIEFANWLLMWHCNQHLIFNKLRLPLKYMNIEIGDILEFNELIGGIAPYGIFYTANSYVNGQLFYPTFLVTKTNKTLEYVEISCEHLPNLQRGITGCMDSDACNHDPAAETSDGSCYYEQVPNECDPCGSGLIDDCNGECGGEAVIDSCGDCTGGTTGYAVNEGPNACTDCSGDPNGTNIIDSCGVCVAFDDISCVEGCDGVWQNDGSQLVLDECGVCGGDGSSCAGGALNCAGVEGGTETVEQCYGQHPIGWGQTSCPWTFVWNQGPTSQYNFGLCFDDTTKYRCDQIQNHEYHLASGDENIWFGYAYGLNDSGVFVHDPDRLIPGNGWEWAYRDPGQTWEIAASPDAYCVLYPERCADPWHSLHPLILTEANCTLGGDQGGSADIWNNKKYKATYAKILLNDANGNPILEKFIYDDISGITASNFTPLPESNVLKIFISQENIDLIDADTSEILFNIYSEDPQVYRAERELSYFDINTKEWISLSIISDNYSVASGQLLHTGLGPIVTETGLVYASSQMFKYDCRFYIDELLSGREIKVIDKQLKFDIIKSDCDAMAGDVNGDGLWNVLDVVTLANAILTNTADELENACAADVNGDGSWNVLDIVSLANCILNNSCEG